MALDLLDNELTDLDLTPATERAEPLRALVPVAEVVAVETNDLDAFYSSIDADDAKKLKAAAMRVNASVAAMNKSALELGRELIAISTDLAGHFEKWLRLEFGMSKATAYNYINTVKQFGDVPKVVETLPPSTVYRLAAKATPAEVRDAVVREIEAGEAPSASYVERRIMEAKKQASLDKLAETEKRQQERKWLLKEKELAEAGKSEVEIAKVKKTWDSSNARKERVAQERADEHNKQVEKAQQETAKSKHTALELVELLRSNLPPTMFEDFRRGVQGLRFGSDLLTALTKPPSVTATATATATVALAATRSPGGFGRFA